MRACGKHIGNLRKPFQPGRQGREAVIARRRKLGDGPGPRGNRTTAAPANGARSGESLSARHVTAPRIGHEKRDGIMPVTAGGGGTVSGGRPALRARRGPRQSRWVSTAGAALSKPRRSHESVRTSRGCCAAPGRSGAWCLRLEQRGRAEGAGRVGALEIGDARGGGGELQREERTETRWWKGRNSRRAARSALAPSKHVAGARRHTRHRRPASADRGKLRLS